MSESARWERASQEHLSPPAPPAVPEIPDTPDMSAPADPPESGARGEPTAEYDTAAAGLIDLRDLADPPEFGRAARDAVGSARDSVAATAAKVGRWFAALDRRPEFDADSAHDPIAELTTPETAAAPEAAATIETPVDRGDGDEATTRFPTAALGYNRPAVDRYVTELEAELTGLRANVNPPISITEEIERLGEQTASILVVAHDKAYETARLAQEQAQRAVTDAAADAQRITAEAQRRLRELDEETDAVWRERERLLDDVRAVSRTLAALADDASARFPADEARGDGVGAQAV